MKQEMKQNTMNLVSGSRLLISNPADPVAKEHFDKTRAALQDSLNKFLRACCAKSKEINQVLGAKLTDIMSPKKTFENPAEEKLYRMKKMAAGRILHVLRTKYDAFDKQWQLQGNKKTCFFM